MNLNNAYKVYCCLYEKHHPGRDPMSLRECINNLTHSLLQQGPSMRERERERGVGAPPSATKNLYSTCSGEGRKVRIDSNRPAFTSPTAAHGRGAVHTGGARSSDASSRGAYKQQQAFKKRKRLQPGRVHQPIPCIVRGKSNTSGSGVRCMYSKCRDLISKPTRE
jgi:hypothetical protein